MTFDAELLELMEDSVTIEPFSSQDADLKVTYGAAVAYANAIVERHEERHFDAQGREFRATARVTLPDRLTIDLRSRITLPSGFVPQQPAIRRSDAHKALGLDHTVLICG